VLLCGALAIGLVAAVVGLAAKPAVVQAGGGKVRSDAKPGAEPAPEKTGGGPWVTFLSHRTGHNVLYRVRPDGTDLKPIFGAS
jgi:hypothetical protein